METKKASEDCGNNNTMEKYWKEIKKKKDSGKTEGQAILDWLKENENNNVKEIKSKAKTNEEFYKKYGRPV